jgi:TatD DNase family protein
VVLTDTHCHLYFDAYQGDLPEIISRAYTQGVRRILVPAIDPETCQAVFGLTKQDEIIYGAVGIHPNSALTWDSSVGELIANLAEHKKIVAIGEIGLDYYRDSAPKHVQRAVLQEQLILAEKQNLPVILHVRNQSDSDRACINDLLSILEDWIAEKSSVSHKKRGVFHSFSGNLEESQRAVKAGFYLGISGTVTYKNALDIQTVVSETNLERLLIETDGPFLTPHPYRGKRNEPAHVLYIVDKISEIKALPTDLVAQTTTSNARRLFSWEN